MHLAGVPTPPSQGRVLGPDVLRDRRDRERLALLPGLHQGRTRADGRASPRSRSRRRCPSFPRTGTATYSSRSWRAGPARPRGGRAPVQALPRGRRGEGRARRAGSVSRHQRCVRRPVPEGHPPILERQLRQGALRRSDRRACRARIEDAHGELRRCTCIRSTALCHRVGPEDTAFGHRDANFAMVVVSAWPDPADDEANTQWVRDYSDAITRTPSQGGYINFMAADDDGRIQANYGRNYDRLVDVKTQVRPRQPLPTEPEHRAQVAPSRGSVGCTPTEPAAVAAVVRADSINGRSLMAPAALRACAARTSRDATAGRSARAAVCAASPADPRPTASASAPSRGTCSRATRTSWISRTYGSSCRSDTACDVQPSTRWEVVLYVDDRTDDAQMAAVSDIFLGRAGGSVARLYGPAIGDVTRCAAPRSPWSTSLPANGSTSLVTSPSRRRSPRASRARWRAASLGSTTRAPSSRTTWRAPATRR